MPFVETTLDARTAGDATILAELERELNAPRATGQPMIEVRHLSRGGVRHAYVIWDRWEECRPEVRTAIVRDAFATVKGADYERSIALTVTATVPEAVELSLLPYEVKLFRFPVFPGPDGPRIRQAMLDEGATDDPRLALPTLHVATEEQAGAAIARLKAVSPAFEWKVVVTAPAA